MTFRIIHPIFALSVLLVLLTSFSPFAVANSQWVKYSANPILGPTAGAWDAWGVLLPRVLYQGSVFRMWYLGYESEPTGTTCVGMANGCGGKIGYATSTNGFNWVKHPSPVLTPGPSGSWDSAEVQPGAVIWNGTHYLMWYSGYEKRPLAGQSRCTTSACFGAIGLAFSKDGISWSKYADKPLLGGNETVTDGISYPYVIRVGGIYRMWYSDLKCAACSGINIFFSKIRYASSTDGIHWVKNSSPVLLAGTYKVQWDDFGVYSPSVIYDGSAYTMWYSAANSNTVNNLYGVTTFTIGYATSNDGLSWTKSEDNPILGLGPPGSWDGSQHAELQDTVLVNNTVLLYYSANQNKTKVPEGGQGDPFNFKIGVATSPQGFPIPEIPSQLTALIAGGAIFTTILLIRPRKLPRFKG